MSSPVVEIFRQAAELTAADPRREGNLLRLGAPRRVVIAGDIHGSRANLGKILSYAAAGAKPAMLILQEVIHGPTDPRTGQDRSVEVLLRAARAKIANPETVCFLLGNHDLAQITGNEITKAGAGVCKAFNEGVRFCFGDTAGEVLEAVHTFCRSLPLAARFDNGVLAAHSLPSPDRAALAGTAILSRPYGGGDFVRGGAAYEWAWGRDQTAEQLDALADELGVAFFVLAHRHLDDGWLEVGGRAVAIRSDIPRGCTFEFNADESVTTETYRRHVKPIARL
jgi:hypothetical protein